MRLTPSREILLVGAALLVTGKVYAQDARPEADVAFQEGRALLAQGEVERACEKLAASYSAAPRHGTLLNLAVCREKQGQFATAFRLFSDSLTAAVADHRVDRERLVREHLDALRSKVAYVSVNASEPVELRSVHVECDGALLTASDTGAYPLNPGHHQLLVRADGAQPYQATLELEAGSTHQVWLVAKAAELPLAPSLPETPQPAALLPAPRGEKAMTPVKADARTGWRTPLGLVLVGVGVVSLAAGGYFGIRAIAAAREARNVCPELKCTTEAALASGRAFEARARREATVANITVPLGVVVAGTGTLLVSLQPASSHRDRVGVAAVQAGWRGSW